MSQIGDGLAEQLQACNAAPFLFVGSGLTRRYLGLEDWNSLLRRFSAPLPQPYEYYLAGGNSDLPRVAGLMADDFYETWWRAPEYQKSRDLYAGQIGQKSHCLKFEISIYLRSKAYQAGLDPQLDDEVGLLKRASVDGIITTNWDTFLEVVFPDYRPYVGQQEILFSPAQGVAEIYKIHGCASRPESLVLTDSDYSEFNDRNPYLAARLLTTFVEHPVVFLGYSLSDPNITQILGQVVACLTTENASRLANRLFFVQRVSAGAKPSIGQSVMQVHGQTLPITVIRTDDFREVYRPLSHVKRRFPARLLRTMKEHLYELVRTNDPQNKIAVLDIEQAEHHQDLEVVFGIGISSRVTSDVGYRALQRAELLKDVVTGQGELEAERVLVDTLPKMLRGPSQYVPVFKYLRESGRIDGPTLELADLDDRVAAAARADLSKFQPPKNYRSQHAEARKLGSVLAVVEALPIERAILLIPLLRREQINTDELGAFLQNNLNLLTSSKGLVRTYFGSLICLYDYLHSGPGASPSRGP